MRQLLLVSMTAFACACAGMEWKGAADGLERLEFSLGKEKRNLIDEGQRLGQLLVKGSGFTLDTAQDHGKVTEDSPNRRVRTWRVDAGGGRAGARPSRGGDLEIIETFVREGEEVRWSIALKNGGTTSLTVTDLGLKLPLGNTSRKIAARRNLNRHESISGAGSWFYWVPYDGMGECMVLLPDEKTPLEYFAEGDWFYIHSNTVREPQCGWRIPATQLALAPGASKQYEFRFFTVKSHEAVADAIHAHGGVNVRVAPSMTVPRGETVRFAVRAKSVPGVVKAEHAATTRVGAWKPAAEGFAVAEASFDRLGENRLDIALDGNRKLYLDFFVTEDLETVVKKRAAFLAKRQQHRNPAKWYNGLYSIFDWRLGRLLSPEDLGNLREPFIVGGSDDPSNSKPVFLSEKNVVHPDAGEIASLEYYEQNFVWGKLQRTDREFPYPCGIYGSDNWYENRSGRAGGYLSGGNGKERMWRTFDYVTHIAIYYNLFRIAKENPSLVHYLDAKGYLHRAFLTAMAYFEVPYNIKMGNQWNFHGWCDWAYKQGNFHERYILDLLSALEENGCQADADRLRREWEKKVTYMTYEDPWPYGSEMFVDRTAFESSYYVAEYALARAMVPQEKFWYDKNAEKWYTYTAYPEMPKRVAMNNQLIANLALRGLNGTVYNRCGVAWTGHVFASLDYMTQMGGVALLDYTTRFANPERQGELLRYGYNSLLASWALVNSGDAASNYGYWRQGAEFDGAAGWCFQSYPKGKPYMPYARYMRGPWEVDGEIDHGFTGGLHGLGCYVAADPVFGEIAYGGRLESDARSWRVTPWDGARKYLVFPQQGRFELRLVNHGFAKGKPIEVAKSLASIKLPLERRGESKTATIEFRKLPKGDWTVRAKGAEPVRFVSDGKCATVTFPFAEEVSIVGRAVAARSPSSATAAHGDYPIKMPRMGTVRATGGFWAAREATNRLVTAKANLAQSRNSGRISNFENAAKKIRGEKHGPFKGTFFNDSDVYKVAEGMAYELALHPDAADEKTLEDLVEKFIAARESDGYIYTARTLGDRHERVGDHRWYCDDAHELYCMGHLIEAAVAHHETTGRDNLLKAVCQTADMMRATFGPGADQIRFLPGHPEVELALCRLYRATGRRAYLELVLDLLDMRGLPKEQRVGEVKRGFPNNRPYYQDHLPVREQKEAVGHAVRACYLYAGMCEAGVLAEDERLLEAVDALWNDIVTKKLYLSGGVGARPEIEGFGPAYDLPNDHVCLETCAAIAHALFNERLFLRSGDAKYLDLIERIAYNGALCSISISGDQFFYPNPMASRGGYKRSAWFGCACCPPNVVRFIPQFINWTYATDEVKNAVYVNFYNDSAAELTLGSRKIKITQESNYPWDGKVKLVVADVRDTALPHSTLNTQHFTLNLRIPGWARGVPTPGGLYTQTEPSSAMGISCTVNGRALNGIPDATGFLTIAGRAWKRGDVVELSLPMEVKRIKANDRIELDRGRLAVERGPLVYCAEGVDNGGQAFNAVLPAEAKFETAPIEIASTKMVAVKGGGLTLVPFFAWCHRGAGEMQTWFATDRKVLANNSQGILAKASYVFTHDTVDALFDGKLPTSSRDNSIRRMTTWPHHGKEEWIEFELPMRKPVKRIKAYWYDDTHGKKGGVGLPVAWKVQTRLFPGLPWTDVKDAKYTIVPNAFSTAEFPKAINSECFRVVVKPHRDHSFGILEMQVE